MRETVAEYSRRTGQAYAPPAWLAELARPLGPREACPTLFRYPGPCGLREHFHGTLTHLGPRGAELLWLTARPVFADTRGAALFGTLAVLQPLGLAPCRTGRRGVYHAVNRPLATGDELVWVPPSALRPEADVPWDALATAGQAERHLRPHAEHDRSTVLLALSAYLEEMDALRRAGAPGPRVRWCEVPSGARRRLLARHGVVPIWTGVYPDATEG